MKSMQGGDPFLGIRAKKPVSDHMHETGQMVWPLDDDGVCRLSYCSSCGQSWELRFKQVAVSDGSMKSVPVAWVPVLEDQETSA